MPKNVTTGFKDRLAEGGTTLCWCCQINLEDGTTKKGFTTADIDLVIDAVTFATKRGFNPTSISSKAGLSTDNLQVDVYYDQIGFTRAQIEGGILKGATIDIFQCFWDDLTLGKCYHLKNAVVGELALEETYFSVEVRGLTEYLEQSNIRVYTPECNVENFCDARCGLSAAAWTVTGAVTSVVDRGSFIDTSRTEPTDVFRYGTITWLTGNNAGLSMEVKLFTPGAAPQFDLFLAMPYAIQVGDTYSALKGCDRKFETCKARSNQVNYRGFPDIPGQAELLKMEYAK